MNHFWVIGANGELLNDLQAIFKHVQYQLTKDDNQIDIFIFDLRNKDSFSSEERRFLNNLQPKVFIYDNIERIPEEVSLLETCKSFIKYPFDNIELLSHLDLIDRQKQDKTTPCK